MEEKLCRGENGSREKKKFLKIHTHDHNIPLLAKNTSIPKPKGSRNGEKRQNFEHRSRDQTGCSFFRGLKLYGKE